MSDVLSLLLPAVLLVGGALLLMRFQQKGYRAHLARHAEETAKVTANQARLIAQTERSQALKEREIAELKRIADALEARNTAG